MKRMNIILPLFLSFLLVLSTYGKLEEERKTIGGNIIYVGGSGPNNYSSIQSAINAAHNGDTIFVYSGIYYEHIFINKSINLIGKNEKTTIIDGRNESNITVFSIEANNVKLSHFTIRNVSPKFFVWGITVSGHNILISNCIIRNTDGLTLFRVENGVIENCNFSHNYEGIFLATKCTNITIKNCTITHNLGKKCPDGGYKGGNGIFFMFDARNFYNISITNCNLSNNRFCGVDASYVEGLIIKNCTIQKNGKGIEIDGVKNVSILNCQIKNNSAYGIDIIGKLNNVLIKNCSITDTKNWSGIEILNKKSGKIYIEECNIKNNPYGVEAVVCYDFKIRNPGGIYIHHSNIYGNKIGIYAKRFSIIDARYNYWGSPLGPSHLLGLRGDKIVTRFSKVFYFPWLMEEYKQ